MDADFEGKLTAIKETFEDGDYDIDLKTLQESLEYYDQRSQKTADAKEINIYIDPSTKLEHRYYTSVIYLFPSFSNPIDITYSAKTR